MDRCLKRRKNNEKEREREEERRREIKKQRVREQGREKGETKELYGVGRGLACRRNIIPAEKDNTLRAQYYNRLERKCIIENDR